MPIAYVAPADNAGIAIALISDPTTGTPFIRLAVPIALLAGIIDPAKAGDDRFAPIFGKRNAVDLRNAAQHLNLDAADGRQVDERHRKKSGSPGPQRETLDQFHRHCTATPGVISVASAEAASFSIVAPPYRPGRDAPFQSRPTRGGSARLAGRIAFGSFFLFMITRPA